MEGEGWNEGMRAGVEQRCGPVDQTSPVFLFQVARLFQPVSAVSFGGGPLVPPSVSLSFGAGPLVPTGLVISFL